jgi:urease accessory protein
LYFFIYEVWMMNKGNMTTKMMAIGLGSTLVISPALAHHPLGGKMVSNPLEGLLSGLAHPVIGLDHLAFVIALGCGSALLAKRQPIARGIPLGFLMAAIAGTAIHLLKVDLPLNELWVALSVLLLGLTIGLGQKLPVTALAGFVTLAGLFHGYAYGEAIVGAETAQLVSYLVGFTGIQALIAYGTFFVVSKLQENQARAIGWVAIGIGLSAVLKAVGI